MDSHFVSRFHGKRLNAHRNHDAYSGKKHSEKRLPNKQR